MFEAPRIPIPGIVEHVRVENGIAFIPPGNEIKILSGHRSRKGKALALNNILEAGCTNEFHEGDLVLTTIKAHSVRLLKKNGGEFILPDGSRITQSSIKNLARDDYLTLK